MYKPDKKVKIKGMRKGKHLSKTQVDVLVIMSEGDGLSVWNDNGKLESWLEDGDKNSYNLQMITVRCLLKKGMIEESKIKPNLNITYYRRTKAADEYLLKYHRERVKDFIS